MKLYHQILGKGTPLVILHGLLGSSDNWQTLGRRWSNHFKVVLLDLINHGRSPHDHKMSYDSMAQDVIETTGDLGLTHFHLLGHSMGGKVAMVCGEIASGLIDSLHILDIAPKTYPANFGFIFKAMEELDLSGNDKFKLDQSLAKTITDVRTRQFILKNLSRNKSGNKEINGFTWKVNLKTLMKHEETLCGWQRKKGEPLSPLYVGPTQFLIGGNSTYVKKEDLSMITILFPHSQIISVDDAGHWIQVEKPMKVEQLVLNFIQKAGDFET